MGIQFKNISKKFGAKSILDQISFEVSRGEILFILGRSGMGKSVTLKHIIGMLKPDSGTVLIDGQDVGKANQEELNEIRRKCGMVFQHPALLDSLNVYENISFGLRTPQFIAHSGRQMTEDEISEKVTEKMNLVHLPQTIRNFYPPEVSYGMQKRISLARTLAPEPKYLLFDEPTTGLDPITTNAVNALILELSRKLSVTSIVVSHDMSCALKVADRILFLEQAKILALGTPQEMIDSTAPLVQDFLRETLALVPPGESLL